MRKVGFVGTAIIATVASNLQFFVVKVLIVSPRFLVLSGLKQYFLNGIDSSRVTGTMVIVSALRNGSFFVEVIEMLKQLELVKNNDLSLPRVTHILSATDSKEDQERLRRWMKKMDKVHGIGGGEQQRDAAANRGTNFHTAIYNYIQSGGEHRPGFVDRERERWEMALRTIDMFRPFVFAMECPVQSNVFGYRGTPDAFAFEKTPQILDWKTSDRFKRRDWIKNYELQVTAYALAAREYGLEVETCHVLIFSPQKAQQFVVNVGDRQDEWLRRLEQYHSLRLLDNARRPLLDQTQGPQDSVAITAA